jgi:hypothetical protein
MGDMGLKHKVLSIAEEEGVRQASYALKLLQSEGQLTIASSYRPNCGRSFDRIVTIGIFGSCEGSVTELLRILESRSKH